MKNKKNKIIMKNLYSYLHTLDGIDSTRECEKLAAALKKTKDIQKSTIKVADDLDMYNLLLEVSKEFKAKVPFKTSKDLSEFYKIFSEIEEITGTDILESSDRRVRFKIPKAVVQEMEKNLTSNFQNILITEAEKFGHCLDCMITKHPWLHFTLTTMDDFYYLIIKEMFKDNSMVDVEKTSIYNQNFINKKFDLILSVPVLDENACNYWRLTPINREYSFIALTNLIKQLSSKGFISIVIPEKIVIVDKNLYDFKELLKNNCYIQEIASLPSGLFESTDVNTIFLNISAKSNEKICIRKYVPKIESPNDKKIHNLLIAEENYISESEFSNITSFNFDTILKNKYQQ